MTADAPPTEALPPPVQLVRIASTSAHITVIAEHRSDVDVRGHATVDRSASQVTVRATSGRLTVRVPLDVDIVIGNSSGSIEVSGRAGAVSAVTESGRVQIDAARSVDVRAASGRIEIGNVTDNCCVRNVSGRIEVAATGDVDVATTSGRIELRGVRGTVHAHCISGRIEIEMLEAHDVHAETVSGRVTVSLPPETVVGVDCCVDARSVSGRVDVSAR